MTRSEPSPKILLELLDSWFFWFLTDNISFHSVSHCRGRFKDLLQLVGKPLISLISIVRPVDPESHPPTPLVSSLLGGETLTGPEFPGTHSQRHTLISRNSERETSRASSQPYPSQRVYSSFNRSPKWLLPECPSPAICGYQWHPSGFTRE